MPIENVVDLRDDPLGDAAVEAMRRYLLRTDFFGGYVPQITFPEPASRLWTALWFAVRRIDDLVDEHGFEVLDSIEEVAGRLDAFVALRAFVGAAPPSAEPYRRVLEMARTPALERELLARGIAPTARGLFELWYAKTYVPTYLVHRLLLTGSEEATIRRLAMLIGAAMQLADDLFDVDEDRLQDRRWLSREERRYLGLSLDSVALPQTARPRLVRLRQAACLSYLLQAHEMSHGLPTYEGWRVRGFLDIFLDIILDGRLRILAAGEKRPWESWRDVFGSLPGPEDVKHRLLHAVFGTYLALPRPPVDLNAARRRLDDLGGCPPELSPAVCLEVMEQMDAHPDHGAGSPLERALALPRPAAEHTPRSRVTAAALIDPTLTEIWKTRLAIDSQALDDAVRQGRRASRKIHNREYRASDLRRDVAEAAGRMLRYSTDLTALGLETLGALARSTRNPPSRGGSS